jgi:hypothetical protein
MQENIELISEISALRLLVKDKQKQIKDQKNKEKRTRNKEGNSDARTTQGDTARAEEEAAQRADDDDLLKSLKHEADAKRRYIESMRNKLTEKFAQAQDLA